jgi:hypothetical protein
MVTNRRDEYLQVRRQLVTPEQAGIPGGSHRRVAGLHREEVALLAGISVDLLPAARARAAAG